MVQRNSGYRSYRNRGVVTGTTNEAVPKSLKEKKQTRINIISAHDHEQSYSLMATGKAEAFATDDGLL
jgi:glutamate/aspartate transport system substrate-binding protein